MGGNRNKRRIVVGIDGSRPSKEALRWAIEQARLTGAVVDAVKAWDFRKGDGWVPVPEEGVYLAKTSEQLVADSVAEVAGEQPPVPVHVAAIEGHAAYVLLQAARDADLLVVGSRGHGGFVGSLLGSVSQYCVHHATCPVVVIRGPHA
jgi:nucleotide-binding universal stress UspA family protein